MRIDEQFIILELDKFAADIYVDYFYTPGECGSRDVPPCGPEIEINNVDVVFLAYPDGTIIPDTWLKDRGFYEFAKQYITDALINELDYFGSVYNELCILAKLPS